MSARHIIVDSPLYQALIEQRLEVGDDDLQESAKRLGIGEP